MNYIGTVIRPPSEAYSIILQVTVGCSYNKCTFCGAYKDKQFRIKDDEIIKADLRHAAQLFPDQNKLFLADGDALIISHKRLVQLFHLIHDNLPWVSRISLYANARALRSKTLEQLNELKRLGLHRVYLGLESGSDDVLRSVNKGETAESMIHAARKVRDAGLFLSVTVLLGLGGTHLSEIHTLKTAETINAMHPHQTAALTLMPLPDTELGKAYSDGTFLLPTPEELLVELRMLVENVHTTTQFYANHASNYLPIVGRLPRDKQKLLGIINESLTGSVELVPESARRL